MLNSDKNHEVCDATEDDSSNADDYLKITTAILNHKKIKEDKSKFPFRGQGFNYS